MLDTALAISVGMQRFARPKYVMTAAFVGTLRLVCGADERHICGDTPWYQTEIEEDITTDQQEALGYA